MAALEIGFSPVRALFGQPGATVTIVKPHIQIVQDLYDRGTGGWVRRSGDVRLTDVPDACPGRLRDDPSVAGSPLPDGYHSELGTMQFLSPEQYFQTYRDRLPAQQWQARGFLVDLDVIP